MEMAINHNDVMRNQIVLTRIYSGEEQVVDFKSGLVIHSYTADDNQGWDTHAECYNKWKILIWWIVSLYEVLPFNFNTKTYNNC